MLHSAAESGFVGFAGAAVSTVVVSTVVVTTEGGGAGGAAASSAALDGTLAGSGLIAPASGVPRAQPAAWLTATPALKNDPTTSMDRSIGRSWARGVAAVNGRVQLISIA